ncbi:MAG: hypothetical protein FWD27_04975 [Coriobacteriia bacterium]|nr:hypothetical protein [Coriobacteriia bacterium]
MGKKKLDELKVIAVENCIEVKGLKKSEVVALLLTQLDASVIDRLTEKNPFYELSDVGRHYLSTVFQQRHDIAQTFSP